jgi:3D (Asp-Asp-Asp) domain-containing protein
MRLRGIALFLISAGSFSLLCGCGIRPLAGVEPTEQEFLVTGYCRCDECCSWHRGFGGWPVYSAGPNKGKRKIIGITASGTKAWHGTIAADTAKYPFGTIMYVEGYGYGQVEDVGEDIKDDRIEIYFNSHSQAMRWGRKTMTVSVWSPPITR